MTAPRVLRVVIIGLGQMGISHARAYHFDPACDIIGLVDRNATIRLPAELDAYPRFATLDEALRAKPDIVCIATHTDTHVSFAIRAMEAGAHVFVEKPLGPSVSEAKTVISAARRLNRKLVVGHILRHHPIWQEFVSQAMQVGPPYVMRMNLNQQSRGDQWSIHKRIMEVTNPVVDCGVHYVELMLQITGSKPRSVSGMGARLSDEVNPAQTNYGHLQVVFEDGSVGWYEAGWGPMISNTAHSTKDVFGPKGSVSLIRDDSFDSADVNGHLAISMIRRHDATTGQSSSWTAQHTPSHDETCALEQAFLVRAIESDVDIGQAQQDALTSLAIVQAADLSMREGRIVRLAELLDA